MKKNLLLIGLILVSIIPVLIGVFHPGFLATDDGNWMVIRLSAFYEALRQGQFPVRFLPRLNNGLGYPVVDFLYPLFLYLGSLIHLFHVPFVFTIKLLFSGSLIVGALGMFFWLRKKFDLLAAFVGAVVYTLFPYHVWDITKRGSLGEVLALGIVPFIFWQIDYENIALTGLGIGLLILAHNTLALLFLPIIIAYILLQQKYKIAFYSIFLGLGVSAFFWIPALYDKQFTVFDKTVVSQFSQYFLSNDLYQLIGIISFVVLALSLFVFFKTRNKQVSFFLVITLLSISLTTNISSLIWQILHFGTYIQFPFRFLSVVALGIGFLAAFCIAHWKKDQRKILAGIIFILVLYSGWGYFFPKTYQYFPDTFYSTNQDSTTVQNEYMPVWVHQASMPSQKVQMTNGVVKNLTDKGSRLTFQAVARTSSQITVALVYFPGWQATIDNKTVLVTPQRQTGWVTFSIPAGKHLVKIFFTETPVRLMADSISGLAVLLTGLLCILSMKKKKK